MPANDPAARSSEKRKRPVERHVLAPSFFPLRRKQYELPEIVYEVESDLSAGMEITNRELTAITDLLGADLAALLKKRI